MRAAPHLRVRFLVVLLTFAVVLTVTTIIPHVGAEAVSKAPAVGVVTGSGNVAGMNAFASATGTAPTVASDSLDPSASWSQLANAGWLLDKWTPWLKANRDRRLVLSVPMLVWSSKGNFNDSSVDRYHVEIARQLAQRGIAAQTIIRLGWQPNAGWLPWSNNAAGFVQMWRRLVSQYRAVSPGLRFDWAPNGGLWPDPATWYPGDDVVDVIGFTQYDITWQSPGGDPNTRWNKMRPFFQWHANFARAHGKSAAIDEWALWTAADAQQGGGGDNPTYVRNVAAWATANNYLYTTYLNVPWGGTNTTLQQNPNALAAYRSSFQVGASPTSTTAPVTTSTTAAVRVTTTTIAAAAPANALVSAPAPAPAPAAAPAVAAAPATIATTKTALGAYTSPVTVGGIDGIQRFGNDVGGQVTHALAYIDTWGSWNDLANPGWLLDPWANWLRANPDRRLVLSVPMLLGSSAGQFSNTGLDTYFVQLAQNIKNRGIAPQVIIRLGWEMNGDWNPYGRQYNQDGSGFKAMWRRIVPKMKAVYDFPFDFCPVMGGPPGPEAFYPGDDVVDIIGFDQYDVWWQHPGGDANLRWNYLLTKTNGLNWFAGWAAQHRKPLALDEWAAWSASDTQQGGGGDNPTFVNNMLQWAKDQRLLWTMYFNTPEGGVGTTLQQNPRALDAFRAFLRR